MLRSAASPGSRGVRPVGGRYEWPPHDTATDRPLPLPTTQASLTGLDVRHPGCRPGFAVAQPGPQFDILSERRYLILASRNSTCFLATGSYFFFTSLSVMVREFLRVT